MSPTPPEFSTPLLADERGRRTPPSPPSVTPVPARKINWADPHRLSQSGWRRLAPQVAVCVSIIALALLDAYLMLTPLQSVLRLDPTTTEHIAIGVAAAAALVAGWTGWTLKGANGEHTGDWKHRILPICTAVMWAGLGVAIATIRLVGGSSRASVSYDGSTEAPSAGLSVAAVASAALFLAFYLALGLVAAGDLYALRNDAAAAYRRTVKALKAQRKHLEREEALLLRLVETLEIRRLQIEGLPQQVQLAQAGHRAHALDLQQLARHEMAVHLRSPFATGITSPGHEDNPARKGTHVHLG